MRLTRIHFFPGNIHATRVVKLSAGDQGKIERLSMALRQTANGKNETFADCLQLSAQCSENIFICGVQ